MHTISAVKIGATVLDGITDSKISTNVEELLVGTDGRPFIDGVGVVQQGPSASFSTVKLAAALGIFGALQKKLDATTQAELYLTEIEDYGTRKATGVKATFGKGLVIPRTLSASQGREATLGIDVFGAGDGANCPLAFTSGQTVPTNLSTDELFTLGEFLVNGASIGEVQDASVTFGVQEKLAYGSGHVFPYAIWVVDYRPVITATVVSAGPISTLGVSGVANTASIQFKKFNQPGMPGATGAITVSTHASRVRVTEVGGSHGGEVTSQITVTPIYDGTNHPLTVAGV